MTHDECVELGRIAEQLNQRLSAIPKKGEDLSEAELQAREVFEDSGLPGPLIELRRTINSIYYTEEELVESLNALRKAIGIEPITPEEMR